ncbi:MAG: SsrA-binding protein SmpB [Candidatus Izimaplasma sp.]|nr:SsrA-binding protein SmpB [Candidatus Izimaplasma bacterium]
MDIIARNKKARHDYFLETTYEAGIALKGTEIKSIRARKANIKEAYCMIKHNELYISNMHISKYKQGNQFNHAETRDRKLLLHRHEINKIAKEINEKGKTVVPTALYIEKGLAKLEIAIAKGKKKYDKRESLKKKQMNREIQRNLNQRY